MKALKKQTIVMRREREICGGRRYPVSTVMTRFSGKERTLGLLSHGKKRCEKTFSINAGIPLAHIDFEWVNGESYEAFLRDKRNLKKVSGDALSARKKKFTRVDRGTAHRAPTRDKLPKKDATKTVVVDGNKITVNFTARTIIIG